MNVNIQRLVLFLIAFLETTHCLSAQEIPRPEHPKPQFQREQWMNLNGKWNFMFDPGNSGKQKRWNIDASNFDEVIIVPFCPESKLSGIDYKDLCPRYGIEYILIKDGEILDRIDSYSGLRKIHISGNKMFLNNKPVFLRFVLDQGFYPEGLWTAPDDKDLKKDIELSMAAGFNGARLHQKVFEERFHYWADKLGYLTWAEFSDWGMDLSNETSYSRFLNEWTEVVERDINHPSVICWTPLNERWPDEFYKYKYRVKKIYDITKAIDPTRPVNDASGWFHIITDIYTVHDYEIRPEVFKERYASVSISNPDEVFTCPEDWTKHKQAKYDGQPYMVDEYGGIYWQQNFTDKEKPHEKDALIRLWGYGKSGEEVLERIKRLTSVLLENPSISGFTYTQLTDVEQELNGIYTFSREEKYSIKKLKEIFAAEAAIEKQNK